MVFSNFTLSLNQNDMNIPTINSSIQIKCPNCGNKFSPEAALEHDVRLHLEKEYEKKLEENARAVEQRTQKAEEEKYLSRIKAAEADRREKSIRLQEYEEKSITWEERERKVKEREAKVELELRRRLLDREKVIYEEATRKASEKANLEIQEKQQELMRDKEYQGVLLEQRLEQRLQQRLREEAERVRQEEQMKSADLRKKLDDQTKLVNEMKRKTDQGSMQAQGEVQELVIEEYLKNTFLRDSIEEISKGKKGGDCIHQVLDRFGNLSGKILYESKRTKNFGGDWTAKLKEDMRLTQADIGVLVTEVLPGEMTRFGLYEGVWVCTFNEFKALSLLFRDSLGRIGEVRVAQENKGDKMNLLYGYLTSTEFRQKIEAIVEAFQQMQGDLQKEKAQTMSLWSKREKQIFKVMENTVSLYGDVRGIAGTAVKEIQALEIEEIRALTDS
jgi:hypothetical protein